jgi:PAS domain S-box-containing protein
MDGFTTGSKSVSSIASPEELDGYRKIYEFSRKLLSSYEPGNILETLVDAIIELTGADHGMLLSLDDDAIAVRVARLANGKPLAHPQDYFSESVVRQAAQARQALLVNDAVNEPTLSHAQSILELSIRSVACLPMFDRGEMLGLIYVCSHSLVNLFTNSHLEVMTIFASQASLLLADALKRDALAQSEARYRDVVQSSPTPIAIFQESKLAMANGALISLLKGRDTAELQSLPLDVFFQDPADAKTVLCCLNNRNGFDRFETCMRDLDGNILHVELSAVPVGDGTTVQLVIDDMTQRKTLLAERLRLDRLVAMGTLAAGVGHEINNPLAYIQANIDYALEEFSNIFNHPGVSAVLKNDAASAVVQADILASLQSAGEGARRIRDVVRGIQAFSRLDEGVTQPVSIEQPLEFSIDMAMSRIRYRARLVRQIEPTPMVLADQSRLGQVFLNLLINAADAIEEGDAAKHAIVVRAFRRSTEVIVEIQDTGPGIAPEVRYRLFEPFVTTKQRGKGTGLGLTISHSIVRDLNGRLEVDSELGQGACFRVVLPAVLDKDGRDKDKDGNEEPSDEPRRARVLVVDDETLLGRALARGLGSQHEVVAVDKAEEALQILDSQRFDVLLCDVRMPGMSGMDLYHELERRKPEYLDRLAFITAGPTDQKEQRFLESLQCPVLLKPFDIRELRHVIDGIAVSS